MSKYIGEFTNGNELEFVVGQKLHKPKIGTQESLASYARKAKQNSRLTNPIAPNQADIVNWVIYDRVVNAAGATPASSTKFFTQPIGSNSKTKVDTNLDQVQRLPDPLWFNTVGVGLGFSPNNLISDVVTFLNANYMEFWVGQKVYLEGPLQCFPAGVGLYLNTTQTGSASLANGLPSINNFFDTRLPAGIHLGNDGGGNPIITDGLTGITILQGQQFHLDIIASGGNSALTASNATPTPGTGLIVNCYLYGILSRGVQ